MAKTAMSFEQEALEYQSILRQTNNLETMLHDMESDFAECARTRKSPCYFCVNQNTCDFQNCNFKWKSHNLGE